MADDKDLYESVRRLLAGGLVPPAEEKFSLEEILSEYEDSLAASEDGGGDAPSAGAEGPAAASSPSGDGAPSVPAAPEGAPKEAPAEERGEDLSLESILASARAERAGAGGGPSFPAAAVGASPRSRSSGPAKTKPGAEKVPPRSAGPAPLSGPSHPEPALGGQPLSAPASPPSQEVDLDQLGKVVGSTVEAVMEESAPPPRPPRRREVKERPRRPAKKETIGPEKPLWDMAEICRRRFRRRSGTLLPGAAVSLIPTVLLALERAGTVVPGWTGDPGAQSALLLACLAASSLLCRHVYVRAAEMLARKRCTSEVLTVLAVLSSSADCVVRLTSDQRTDAMPYAAVACLGLAFAQWGAARESQGMYDTFRTAALDEDPPYLVEETARGACKRRGAVPGFYTAALRDDGATLAQTALLPVVLAASLVFAGLASQSRPEDFFLTLSALLCAGATFSLPLCWGLPFSRLARHLQKTGCAVAGWYGAERICRRRAMVCTDADLFPPGTVRLNGVKVYDRDLQRLDSYAASMVRAAGCGLERIFDDLLRGEMGHYEEVEDFTFYAEGGWSGVIRQETVHMGTESFLRRMGVHLPGGLRLKTGLFLSVDRKLAGVFAIKYTASDNVDFALRLMERSKILPILAVRDPDLDMDLLCQKFHQGLRAEIPDMPTRVALSEAERDRGSPRALIFREGLLPYAETVVGSRFLCRSVRWSTALSCLGSIAGTLLAYYLTSLGQWGLLTPLALELFLLLWTLPVLLISGWASRY